MEMKEIIIPMLNPEERVVPQESLENEAGGTYLQGIANSFNKSLKRKLLWSAALGLITFTGISCSGGKKDAPTEQVDAGENVEASEIYGAGNILKRVTTGPLWISITRESILNSRNVFSSIFA